MMGRPEILTIGHGALPVEVLINNLLTHDASKVIDIRSQPGSRWAPQFGRDELSTSLAAAGIDYEWEGERLGGRPPSHLKTEAGLPNYELMVQEAPTREALDQLTEEAICRHLVLLCSETDPNGCHRNRMLAPELERRGAIVNHILLDGSLLNVPTLFA